MNSYTFQLMFLLVSKLSHHWSKRVSSGILLGPLLEKFSFNWWIISLQRCVTFCHTSTRISHRHTHAPPLEPLFPLPPHLIPLGWHRAAPELPTSYSKCPLVTSFPHGTQIRGGPGGILGELGAGEVPGQWWSLFQGVTGRKK